MMNDGWMMRKVEMAERDMKEETKKEGDQLV